MAHGWFCWFFKFGAHALHAVYEDSKASASIRHSVLMSILEAVGW